MDGPKMREMQTVQVCKKEAERVDLQYGET
jgi:hypothetical protein